MNYDDLKAKAFTLNGKTYAPIGKDATGRDIYGPVVFCPVATEAQQPERPRSLDSQKPRREKRKGRVAVVVSIIACRARETDEDNFIAGTKWLKDSIAATLGLDDGDRRIRWEYGQIETRGEQGVIVKITAQNK